MNKWYIRKAWYGNAAAAIWCGGVAAFIASRGEYPLSLMCAALSVANAVWAYHARLFIQGTDP